MPYGARGELAVTWTTGEGHSMAFEMVKGKPNINTGEFRDFSILTDGDIDEILSLFDSNSYKY